MKMSSNDWMNYIITNKCCICHEEIQPNQEKSQVDVEVNQPVDKVRHHYHGDRDVYQQPAHYVGASHSSCNLSIKSRQQLTVLLHNFGSFDSKFIISGCTKAGVKDIKVLAKSSEKYISIELEGKLRFIDSYAHLPSSLSTLANNLKDDTLSKFNCTKSMLPGLSEDQYKLILGKQLFPYEYANPQTLDIANQNLPDVQHFHSSLKNSTASIEDWQLANNIYKMFKCKTLRDYLKIYNILDVGLLGDVFEEHRRQCHRIYNIEPLNFVSLPGVSFASGMAASNQTLDYIHDIDFYLLVKESMRGGIVNCSKRYAKSNVRGKSTFDPSQPASRILQLDINSLYPFVMQTCKLPNRNFKKLTQREVDLFDITKIDVNGTRGFLMKVDVKIDDRLHDYFDALPLMPEKIKISDEEASEFQKDMMENNEEVSSYFNKEQYLCTLYDKKEYVIFSWELKQALELGYTLEKIHSIWQFDQQNFMKSWVKSGIKRRNNAKCVSEKNLYKLFLNSFYGRTSVNVAKFRDFKIATDHIRAQQLVRKPNFKNFTIIDESMSLIEMKKTKVVLNNHILIGSAILSLARTYFYKVYYSIKEQLAGRVELLYCDTDAVSIKLDTEDYLADLKSVIIDGEEIMDFSYLPNKPEFSNYKSDKYKGKPGKLKSETNEILILEAVFLKKKCYSFLLDCLEYIEKNKLKGLPACFLLDYCFQTYKDTLFKGSVTKIKIHMMRSLKLVMYNIIQNRLAFNPICDSRFLCDRVTTLAFGNKRIVDGVFESVLED